MPTKVVRAARATLGPRGRNITRARRADVDEAANRARINTFNRTASFQHNQDAAVQTPESIVEQTYSTKHVS